MIKTIRKKTQQKLFCLRTEDIMTAELVINGHSIEHAFDVIFGKGTKKRYIRKKDLTRNPLFLQAILTGTKVKDEFKDEGLDATWLAKQLKTIVEDPDSNPKLRMDALNIVKEVIDDKKKQGGGLGSLLSQTFTVSEKRQIETPLHELLG